MSDKQCIELGERCDECVWRALWDEEEGRHVKLMSKNNKNV
jgi:hypothetical protein